MRAAVRVLRLDGLDLDFEPRPWRFAAQRRAEIDRHFAAALARNPSLWNGRVLMMHRYAVAGGIMTGAYLETDFASFIACRDWGFPDPDIWNCFALGALQGSDGAFLLGVMADHTMNAGRIYFPGGTPEPSDIFDRKVDLRASVLREVEEETGLSPEDLAVAPDWHAVISGQRIALLKILRAAEPAEVLRRRILANCAAQAQPELADIRIVRGTADFEPAFSDFMLPFLVEYYRDR